LGYRRRRGDVPVLAVGVRPAAAQRHQRRRTEQAFEPVVIKAHAEPMADQARRRIASPGMLPEAGPLPHLICSRPIFFGGVKDEADQHDDA
jgi:hypothetical protein